MATDGALFILDFEATGTILEVVNQLISSLGESPVASYDPSPSVDVDIALGCINEADKFVQHRGWEWNRNYDFLLQPNADGLIYAPNNTLRATLAYNERQNWLANCVNGHAVKVVLRGKRFYDQTNNTYDFTGKTMYVDYVERLQWDDIPDTAKAVIAYEALKRFQSRVQQSSIVLQFNAQDLAQAWKLLEQQQDAESRDNVINGNASVRSRLYGTGGMRRNRAGY
jgi:hypothetical protein